MSQALMGPAPTPYFTSERLGFGLGTAALLLGLVGFASSGLGGLGLVSFSLMAFMLSLVAFTWALLRRRGRVRWRVWLPLACYGCLLTLGNLIAWLV